MESKNIQKPSNLRTPLKSKQKLAKYSVHLVLTSSNISIPKSDTKACQLKPGKASLKNLRLSV